MRKFFASLIITLTALVSSTGCAEAFSTENTLLIKGPIAGPTMEPISARMDELLVQEQAPSVVKLIIDSPGGSVYSGFRFIAQMKSLQGKGTKFVCYVPGLAASMAFHILTHCDRRVVLEESALLWHRARVFVMFGVLTAPNAAAVARDLQAVDDHILTDVIAVLKKDMSLEDINYHFDHETLHIGQKLCNSAPGFCVAKSHVPGLMEAVNDPAIISTRTEKDLENRRKANMFTGLESMVYIYTKYIAQLKGE